MMETIVKLAPWMVIAFAASLPACAARSGIPTPERDVVVQRIQGPYVLAGTEFDAELEQPLAAEDNRPGDAFAARVKAPLRAPNGKVVVPAGARVTGQVVDAVVAGGSALALKFDSIDTARGPVAVHATVQSAGAFASVTPMPRTFAMPEGVEVDALLRPAPGKAIGGGPPEPGVPHVVRPVRIPAGTVVRMALLDPLIPPGVHVEVPPREFLRPPPAYNEPPYRSNFPVGSDPVLRISP
jgi:hypothetical protein